MCTKPPLIPLLFCVGGGIVFALSPGNFKRQAGVDSTGIHIGKAIKNALYVEGIFGYSLLRNVLIGILLIGIIVLSYVYARRGKDDLKFVNPLKTFGWFIMIMFCVIFPVTLGYSSADMPNRIQYIINTYMTLGLSICVANLGFWFGSKYTETLDAKSVRMLCFVMMIAIYLGPLSKDVIGTTPYVRQIKGHAGVVACHDDWIDILNEIASSQDKDVVIKRDKIVASDIIKTPELSPNPEKWINVGTAGFFGKDSVSVIVNDN